MYDIIEGQSHWLCGKIALLECVMQKTYCNKEEQWILKIKPDLFTLLICYHGFYLCALLLLILFLPSSDFLANLKISNESIKMICVNLGVTWAHVHLHRWIGLKQAAEKVEHRQRQT